MFSYRRLGALVASTTVTALVVTTAPAASAQEDQLVEISIANFTDFHGRLEAGLSTSGGELAPEAGDEMGAANIAGILSFLREDTRTRW